MMVLTKWEKLLLNTIPEASRQINEAAGGDTPDVTARRADIQALGHMGLACNPTAPYFRQQNARKTSSVGGNALQAGVHP